MGALFSKPKTPNVPPPPPLQRQTSSSALEAEAREIARRRNIGRAANILSQRDQDTPTSAAQLLGA